jgi:phage repressor protein C with HTH and peptisase S24 domain
MNDIRASNSGICERLKAVREKVFGPRGRATFAKSLGLSPSTYNYYEKNRVPPPEALARAAQVAGVRLEWLITGQGPRDLSPAELRRAWSADLPAGLQVALERFMEQSGQAPNSPAAVAAMAEVLAQVRDRFCGARAGGWQSGRVQEAEGMIPILGRTAAGLVGTYEELLGEEPAVTVADVARRAMGLDVRSRAAAAVAADDPLLAGDEAVLAGDLSLVQLSEPLPSGVVEFIDAPEVRRRFPSAFALRVDGESMRPRFRHGDVVVAVVGRPVRAGQAALVQVRGRVGITLKLVRREEGAVFLVPINETFETERLAAEQIEWMAPVLLAARFAPLQGESE